MASRERIAKLFLYTVLGWGEAEDVVTWLAGPSLPPFASPSLCIFHYVASSTVSFCSLFSSLPWFLLLSQIPSLAFLHPWNFLPHIIFLICFATSKGVLSHSSPKYSLLFVIFYPSTFSSVSFFFSSSVSLLNLSSGFSWLFIIIPLSARVIHPLTPASTLALLSPPFLLVPLVSSPSLCLALWLSPLPDTRLKLRFVACSWETWNRGASWDEPPQPHQGTKLLTLQKIKSLHMLVAFSFPLLALRSFWCLSSVRFVKE